MMRNSLKVTILSLLAVSAARAVELQADSLSAPPLPPSSHSNEFDFETLVPNDTDQSSTNLVQSEIACPEEMWPSMQDVWFLPSEAWTISSEFPLRSPLRYKRGFLMPLPSLTRESYGSQSDYTLTPYVDRYGRAYRIADDGLPGAADPNDFQSSALLGTEATSLGVAMPIVPWFLSAPPEYSEDPVGPKARLGLQARPGIFYDTGFVGTTFSPEQIALDGTANAKKRGQITFYDFGKAVTIVPGRGQVDLQSLEFLNLTDVQVYLDAFAPNERDVDARSIYARLLTNSRQSAFLIGKAETLFGDVAGVPTLIQSGSIPIGAISPTSTVGGEAVFTGIPQLRYSRYWDETRFELSGSIEDQSLLNDVVVTQNNTTLLNRYPVFAGRFRYSPTKFNSFQLAALVRPLVIDDPNFNDHTTTGWGVSGIARFCNAARTDAVFLGATTGEGIGGYIYGGTVGAITPTATTIDVLSNTGAYVGYQHIWYRQDENHNLSSNIAYGYVTGDAPRADDNRELHQAWANLLWNVTETTGVGFEYQYGLREVGDGRTGDDHRFMFVLQLKNKTKASTTDASRYSYDDSERTSLSNYRL